MYTWTWGNLLGVSETCQAQQPAAAAAVAVVAAAPAAGPSVMNPRSQAYCVEALGPELRIWLWVGPSDAVATTYSIVCEVYDHEGGRLLARGTTSFTTAALDTTTVTTSPLSETGPPRSVWIDTTATWSR